MKISPAASRLWPRSKSNPPNGSGGYPSLTSVIQPATRLLSSIQTDGEQLVDPKLSLYHLPKSRQHGLECIKATMSAALPYHEPGIVDILILSSFLFILNVLNSIIDSHLYCGLISQILIGIAWGAPGAAWLSFSSQETITQLGYLGLILLVFEGGLSTSIPALKSNLLLSVAVATVGIVLPLALSFSLMGLADATPLQAFAAGAALCSTSLGTTFTLLSSSGLVTSRLGVVLSSAAMLDDVVGLVMVQIISNLGTSSSLSAVIIIRPILVSLGFATILPVVCVFIFKPVMYSTFGHSQRSILKWRKSNAHGFHIPFITQTLLLVTFITGASYAGTSTLFTAYLAGATISWWDAEKEARNRVHSASFMDPAPSANVGLEERDNTIPSLAPEQSRSCASEKTHHRRNQRQQEEGRLTGAEIYTHYVENAVRRILKPFFFVSCSLQKRQLFTFSDGE